MAHIKQLEKALQDNYPHVYRTLNDCKFFNNIRNKQDFNLKILAPPADLISEFHLKNLFKYRAYNSENKEDKEEEPKNVQLKSRIVVSWRTPEVLIDNEVCCIKIYPGERIMPVNNTFDASIFSSSKKEKQIATKQLVSHLKVGLGFYNFDAGSPKSRGYLISILMGLYRKSDDSLLYSLASSLIDHCFHTDNNVQLNKYLAERLSFNPLISLLQLLLPNVGMLSNDHIKSWKGTFDNKKSPYVLYKDSLFGALKAARPVDVKPFSQTVDQLLDEYVQWTKERYPIKDLDSERFGVGMFFIDVMRYYYCNYSSSNADLVVDLENILLDLCLGEKQTRSELKRRLAVLSDFDEILQEGFIFESDLPMTTIDLGEHSNREEEKREKGILMSKT